MRGAELVGQKFGRLTVIGRGDQPPQWRTAVKGRYWNCLCDCGQYHVVSSGHLLQGIIQSCGCARIKHGGYKNGKSAPEYRMFDAAKSRAKRLDLSFNIEITDIKIPSHCPILGIPLSVSVQYQSQCSPSLDRIIPKLGYVKGNIQVISQRANVMKNDASLEELEKFANYIQRMVENERRLRQEGVL